MRPAAPRDIIAARRRPPPPLCWDDLRVALAVSRAGSLTRAAEALGVDSATVSRRLAALEAALGTTLFARHASGAAPTSAGAVLLARAAEMEVRAMRLPEEVLGGAECTGVVRLCGGPWVLARVAALLAPRLRRAAPGIELRLVSGRPPVDLPGGEASLALWFEATPRSGDFAVPLGEVPYAIYRPAGAGAAPRLAHRNEDGIARAPDLWAEARREPGEGFALCANDSLLLHAAVRAGLGEALLPLCLGEADPALCRADPQAPPALARTLFLHAHPDTVQLARLQVVIGLLREGFAALFGAAPCPRRPTLTPLKGGLPCA